MYFQIGLFLWELWETRDMFHAERICWKIFEQIGIGIAYLHVFFFLIKMHEIDTAAEMYLEPFPTYMFELFLQK